MVKRLTSAKRRAGNRSQTFSLGDHQDFKAIYCLIVGALALKASTEMLRPRGGSS